MTRTAKIQISPFVAYEASGSGISNPDIESGYQAALVRELHRVVPSGGVINVDMEGLLDLAEWCDDLANAVGQGGNTSGARALTNLATKATRLSKEIQDA